MCLNVPIQEAKALQCLPVMWRAPDFASLCWRQQPPLHLATIHTNVLTSLVQWVAVKNDIIQRCLATKTYNDHQWPQLQSLHILRLMSASRSAECLKALGGLHVPHLWHSFGSYTHESWYTIENHKDFETKKQKNLTSRNLLRKGPLQCGRQTPSESNRLWQRQPKRPRRCGQRRFWYTLQWGHTKVWQCHPKQRLNKKTSQTNPWFGTVWLPEWQE